MWSTLAPYQDVKGSEDDSDGGSNREHVPDIFDDAESIEQNDDADGHAIERKEFARTEEETDAERHNDEDGPPGAEERESVDHVGGNKQPDHTCHEQQGAEGNGPEGFHCFLFLYMFDDFYLLGLV